MLALTWVDQNKDEAKQNIHILIGTFPQVVLLAEINRPRALA